MTTRIIICLTALAALGLGLGALAGQDAGSQTPENSVVTGIRGVPEVASVAGAPGVPGAVTHSEFTGEILTVLFVSDLPKSVAFYTDVLGFRFDHYYDHHTGGSTTEWTYHDSPLYAEMWSGPSRFALHLAKKEYEKTVGGSIHYFAVSDVGAHHAAITEHGGSPGEVIDRPWMTMFSIEDPDGHRLYFQKRAEED